MADCESPKCREEIMLELKGRVKHKEFNDLKTCAGGKVSRKTLAAFLGPVILIVGIGIAVWAGQESDHLRYVPIKEGAKHARDISNVQEQARHIFQDLKEIKRHQTEQRRDTKEILRHLRDRSQ